MEKRKQLIFLEDSKGIVKTKNKNGHLYALSNDEIKLFDWVYNNKENIVEQINSKTQLIFVLEENKENQTFKKIIATTNKTLSQTNRTEIPQPSQQFIQKYIEEYNRGNIITDVLVEYELISNEEYFGNTVNPDNDVPYFDEDLKINPKYNTISIKKVKDSYTKEEVDRMLDEQASKTTAEMMEKFKDYKSREEIKSLLFKFTNHFDLKRNIEITLDMQSKWIEENL